MTTGDDDGDRDGSTTPTAPRPWGLVVWTAIACLGFAVAAPNSRPPACRRRSCTWR